MLAQHSPCNEEEASADAGADEQEGGKLKGVKLSRSIFEQGTRRPNKIADISAITTPRASVFSVPVSPMVVSFSQQTCSTVH